MATGGIVAFADKGQVKETDKETSRFSQTRMADLLNFLSPDNAQQESADQQKKYNDFIAASQQQPGYFEKVSPEQLKASDKRISDAAKQLTSNKPAVNKTAAPATAPAQPPVQQVADTSPYPSGIMGGASLPNSNAAPSPQKTASTRATGSAPAAKASVKIPDQLQPAVSQLAEQTGQKEDDVKENMKSYMQMFQDMYAPSLEAQRKMVEASKPDNEAIKQQGLAQALTAFGFKMAANASKSGSRFLESASAAAPEITSAAQDMNKLMAAKQENYQKMNLDQMRYENALTVGNMKDATMLANQLRQAKQLDKQMSFQYEQLKQQTANTQAQLAELSRHNIVGEDLANRQLGVTAGYYNAIAGRQPDTVSGLAQQLMKDPSFKGTQNDAIAQAANMLKGGIPAEIRSEASLAAKRATAIEKAQASTAGTMLAMTPKTDPKYAERKAAFEEQIQRELALLSPNAGISSAAPLAGSTKPSGVTVTEIGR